MKRTSATSVPENSIDRPMDPDTWSRSFGDEELALGNRHSIPAIEMAAWAFTPGVYSGGGGARRHTLWINPAPLRFRVHDVLPGSSRATYAFGCGATTFQRGGDFGSVSARLPFKHIVVAIDAKAFAEFLDQAGQQKTEVVTTFGEMNTALLDFVCAYLRMPIDSRPECDTVASALFPHLAKRFLGLEMRRPEHLPRSVVERVDEYARHRIARTLSLRELARVAEMSPWRFARAFAATLGETPHRYVMRLRCDEAAHLLTATALPISYIACEVGFVDQSHLTKWTKSTFAATPLAIRAAAA